jgi:hypothetical protein
MSREPTIAATGRVSGERQRERIPVENAERLPRRHRCALATVAADYDVPSWDSSPFAFAEAPEPHVRASQAHPAPYALLSGSELRTTNFSSRPPPKT